MSDKLQFIFELLDKASPVGKKIADVFRDTGKAAADVKSPKLEGIEGGVKGTIAGFTKLKETIAGVVGAVAAFALVKWSVHGLTELTKFAVEAAESKRHTLMGLESLEGSKEAAAETLEDIQAASNQLGINTDKLADSYKELRAVGYEGKAAFDVLNAAADQAVVAGESGGDAFMEAMKKLKAGDSKLDEKELKPLFTKAAIPLEELYKDLAKAKKITTEEVRALMKAGEIEADVGIAAILSTVQRLRDKGGLLGSLAREDAGQSVTKQWQIIKNKFEDLFEDVKTSTLATALGKVAAQLDENTAAGKRFKAEVMGAFDKIGETLASVLDPSNIEAMLTGAATLLPIVVELTKAFADGSIEQFKASFLDYMPKGKDGATDMAGAMRSLGKVVGFVAAGLIWFGLGVAGIVNTIGDAFKTLPDNFATVMRGIGDALIGIWDMITGGVEGAWDGLVDLGKSIVDGIIKGIKDAWVYLKVTWNSLVDELPAAVAAKLKIASPSKVMAELGGYAVEGFKVGAMDAANDTHGTVAASVTNLLAGAGDVDARSFTTGGGAARGGFHVTINVTPPAGMKPEDAEGLGRTMARAFRDELADVLDGLNAEAAA